jgi:hypothetical protein
MCRMRYVLAHRRAVIVFAVVAVIVVLMHVDTLPWGYLGKMQLRRHNAVLDGEAGDPWQYRILSEQLMRPIIAVLDAAGVPDHESWAFFLTRAVQGFAIFVLAAELYRQLGHTIGVAFVGVGLIVFGMVTADYDSDLSFNTYSDVLFYLAAALLAIRGRWWWIAALMPFAVANRETALAIPILMVAVGGRHVWRPAAVALLAGAGTYAAIRAWYGPRELLTAWGHTAGVDMIRFNVRNEAMRQVALTAGTATALAVLGWRHAGRVERRLVVGLAVPWLAVHFVVASIVETRLLLVPLVVAVIPAALAVTRVGSGVGGGFVQADELDGVAGGERSGERVDAEPTV